MKEEYGKGAKRDQADNRDRIYEALGTSYITEEEWVKGYDIEKKLNIKIPIKNQYQSYSCVGQAYAYYMAVLNAIETKAYKEISAKAIYSLIALGYGKGAYLRDGSKSAVNFGALFEETVKSYKENGKTDEAFMIGKEWLTAETRALAQFLKAKEYYTITGLGIEVFARAIRDGYGMVAGVDGTNNGTWGGYEPKPPKLDTPYAKIWGHGLFFGKFGIDRLGKFVATPNSWGERLPDSEYIDGWQKIREDYFINNNRFIFNPWVLIDQKNNMDNDNDNTKIIKDKNSNAVGFWLPAISEDVFISLCLNFGIEVIRKNTGELDWDKMIDGELTLKN